MNVQHTPTGGQPITVRRLTAREAAELHALADEWMRDAPDFRKGVLGNLWSYANSVPGGVEILSKVGMPDDQIDALERYDMAALALKVCGFKLPEGETEDDRDGADRPTSANGSGTG